MNRNIGIALSPETGDLEIKVVKNTQGKIISGLLLKDITRQNQAVLIGVNPGEIKEAPAIGVGIQDVLLDHELLSVERQIRMQLENEGMTIKTFRITKDYIDIDADYRQ